MNKLVFTKHAITRTIYTSTAFAIFAGTAFGLYPAIASAQANTSQNLSGITQIGTIYTPGSSQPINLAACLQPGGRVVAVQALSDISRTATMHVYDYATANNTGLRWQDGPNKFRFNGAEYTAYMSHSVDTTTPGYNNYITAQIDYSGGHQNTAQFRPGSIDICD
jgi:hypothetical protein